MTERRFFHSFPRPKKDETKDATISRGLSILSFMKEFGLVLAPEIVEWDVSKISGGNEQLKILQRRACFTELSQEELPRHSAIFGPIALSFDLSKLRGAGAMPVIYIPQGVEASILSQIGTFCARGAYHTKYVLQKLDELKAMSDPTIVAKQSGMPVMPNYSLNLQNTDSVGKIVAQYSIAASSVHDVLQYVGFNNIPFDHSIGILGVFLNMFYPTDNLHSGDELGYYRQREWRLIASDFQFNGRPIGHNLSTPEIDRLKKIDPQFWTREIMVDGVKHQRSSLAFLYDPIPNWNFFEFVEAIFIQEHVVDQVKGIVGNHVPVYPYEI